MAKAKSGRDHLDRDALAAQKAGLSYGQYKAEHPHTYYPETQQPEEEPAQERRQRDRQYNARHYAEAKKEKPPAESRACAICGKTFLLSRNHVKYCSIPCREQGRKLVTRAKDKRYRERKKEEKQNV